MNLPNALTVFRFGVTLGFIHFLSMPGLRAKVVATILFGVAAVTDFLDGYLARKYNLVTVFGKIMDPVADKFLTLSAFFMLAKQGLVAFWMVAVIAVREVLITFLRLTAMRQGVVLAAERSGKIKTVLQMTAIIFMLGITVGREVYEEGPILAGCLRGIWFGMVGVVGITVWSGVSFLWVNRTRWLGKVEGSVNER